MFAEKLFPLIDRNPQEAESLRRMADYFEGIELRQGARVFNVRLDPNRIFDISQAGSVSRLAKVLKILVEAKIFERRIIVRSPSGAGLEYRSYADVPEVVRDPVSDIEMEVTQDNLESSYIVISDE
jgi:hypothetical protein